VVPTPHWTIPLVSIMASVGKSYGEGTIAFPSNPHAHPILESRLLVEPRDRKRAIEAMQLAAELTRTPEMRDLATQFWPPRGVVERPGGLEAWIDRISDSSYHPCSTVPMGGDEASDEEAATDGRGRVRHIEGLVVADASLMPTIPSSHINLTTLMMGERFGEWLRKGEL